MSIVLTPKRLARVRRHDFTKEFRPIEYETKFAVKQSNRSSLTVLNLVRGCFKNDERFVLCKIYGGDKLLTRVQFFLDGEVEYSLFTYRGARMIKIKKHTKRPGFPAITVQELVRQTHIKRPTVYHALETLMQKGLVAKRGTGSRLQFVMSPPERLRHLIDQKITGLEKQKDALDAVLPLLTTRAAAADRVQAMQFDGIEGIKTLVEEALYCRSRHWDILAPRKNFFSDFDQKYADYFLSARRARGITARSLWEDDPNGRVLSATEIRERQPRILPPSMHGKFQNVIILFDETVAIISSLTVSSAVLIQSSEVHTTMNAIFDVLWEVSKPYTPSAK